MWECDWGKAKKKDIFVVKSEGAKTKNLSAKALLCANPDFRVLYKSNNPQLAEFKQIVECYVMSQVIEKIKFFFSLSHSPILTNLGENFFFNLVSWTSFQDFERTLCCRRWNYLFTNPRIATFESNWFWCKSFYSKNWSCFAFLV